MAQKLLSLSLDEFLCRFLLHVLPKGFVRIHNFGFLAKRVTLLPLCFHLLGSIQEAPAEPRASSTEDSPGFLVLPEMRWTDAARTLQHSLGTA